MSEYHDRSLDDPHTPAEDRPVAGWPGHDPGPHADEQTGERTDQQTDEPLVGEVWNEETDGERDAGTDLGGRREHTEEGGVAEGEAVEDGGTTGHDHVTEPFGTEEPMVIDEAETAALGETASGETASGGTEPAAASEAVAPVTAGETGAPADTTTEAGTEPAAEGTRPTAADEFSVENLLDPEAAERFRDRWRDVKAVFVDDPANAVRQASDLSGDAVDELTTALGRLRQELDGQWGEGKETDTERLRVALRGYGSLIDRILTR